MKIDENQIDLIMNKSLEEKWKLFRMLKGEYQEWEQDYLDVRYGIDIKFDINFAWQKQKNVYMGQSQKMMVIGGNKINIEDFNTELEKREDIINQALLNNVEGGVVIPR